MSIKQSIHPSRVMIEQIGTVERELQSVFRPAPSLVDIRYAQRETHVRVKRSVDVDVVKREWTLLLLVLCTDVVAIVISTMRIEIHERFRELAVLREAAESTVHARLRRQRLVDDRLGVDLHRPCAEHKR